MVAFKHHNVLYPDVITRKAGLMTGIGILL